MRIALLGFGLIGGSVALALRRPGASLPDRRQAAIAAWSRSPAGVGAALADGVLDVAAASPAEAIVGADLVVLAAPPLACLELLDGLADGSAGPLPQGATITDVASTKRAIGERADRLGLRFVGGHPMAGREATGYGSAVADLFVDRPWVVCPGAASADADVARVEALAVACGARPLRVDASTHDAAVAAISHLPLVLSAALADAVVGGPAWPVARTLAASGWHDMTRLARGDPAMGAGIVTTNAAELASRLRALRVVIDTWLALIDEPRPDPAALAARFEAVRRQLEEG